MQGKIKPAFNCLFVILLIAIMAGCGTTKSACSSDAQCQAGDKCIDGRCDFVPPSPAYGYYVNASSQRLESLTGQLGVFAANNLIIYLGLPSVLVGEQKLLDFLKAADGAGVEVRVWLLLPSAQGKWPGEENAAQFAAAALACARWIKQEGLKTRWIVVDLEGDAWAIDKLIRSGKNMEAILALLGNYDAENFDKAAGIYQKMVDDLEALGFKTMVVTHPLVLDDLEDGDTFLQNLIDAPVSPVKWHEVSFMPYSTSFGDSTGLRFGPSLAYQYALSAVKRFGNRASMGLGVSDDLKDADTLAAEIGAVKAAGIERIQVFTYSGIEKKTDPAKWREAFKAQPSVPPLELSTEIVRGIFRDLDRILEAVIKGETGERKVYQPSRPVKLAVKSYGDYDKILAALPLLESTGTSLYLSITRSQLGLAKLVEILQETKRRGITTIICPNLGVFANEDNVLEFSAFVFKILELFEEKGLKPEWFAVNMENPNSQMQEIREYYYQHGDLQGVVNLLLGNIDRQKFQLATERYRRLVDMLHSYGYKVMVVTYNYLVDDFLDGDPDWQDVWNSPIQGIDWDALTFFAYRTIWSGDLGMKVSPAVVYDYGVTARELFGDRARMAIGTVGATGHGPGYTSPADMAEDIAAARAAGIFEVDIFKMKGILDQADPASWLTGMSDVPAAAPSYDMLVDFMRSVLRTIDRYLDDYPGGG